MSCYAARRAPPRCRSGPMSSHRGPLATTPAPSSHSVPGVQREIPENANLEVASMCSAAGVKVRPPAPAPPGRLPLRLSADVPASAIAQPSRRTASRAPPSHADGSKCLLRTQLWSILAAEYLLVSQCMLFNTRGTGHSGRFAAPRAQRGVCRCAQQRRCRDVSRLCRKLVRPPGAWHACVSMCSTPTRVAGGAAGGRCAEGALATDACAAQVVLDVGGAEGPLPEELLRCVAVLSPNETELQRMTGMPTGSRDEVVQAARHLQRQGARDVLVKLGRKGSLLVAGAAPACMHAHSPTARLPLHLLLVVQV